MVGSEDLPQDRVNQAGADILRISQTVLLVAVDEVDLADPWFHPAWRFAARSAPWVSGSST